MWLNLGFLEGGPFRINAVVLYCSDLFSTFSPSLFHRAPLLWFQWACPCESDQDPHRSQRAPTCRRLGEGGRGEREGGPLGRSRCWEPQGPTIPPASGGFLLLLHFLICFFSLAIFELISVTSIKSSGKNKTTLPPLSRLPSHLISLIK